MDRDAQGLARGRLGVSEPQHVITLRDGEVDGFVLEVVPPPEGVGHDQEFRTHKHAYGYAVGLRMSTGWPVMDMSSDGSRI